MTRLMSLLSCMALTTHLAAQAPTLPPERQALWREIRLLNDSVEAAFNRGDMAVAATFYAADARMRGPRTPEVRGRTAIDGYWAGIRNPVRWTLEVLDVGGDQALASQLGRSHLTSRGRDGVEHTSVTDFLVVWERQGAGPLRMVLDLWN